MPTEAEWEYVARGPQERAFPWGDSGPACGLAQYEACGGRTVAVGSYQQGASWCGALDMAGNVWEWVADWYAADYYGTSPSRNPVGPSSGENRAMRGGGWLGAPEHLRGADRGAVDPSVALDHVGFRCVRGSP